jgi:hypothetical protein
LHDHAIPAHVTAFIVDHISSVIQLEVLLLLHLHRDRARSAADLGRELRIDPEWVDSQAQTLCQKGVLVCGGDAHREYQFAPRTPEMARAVDDLAQLYDERRVSVITLIFNKPVDQAQSFADAFRIRRNGGNG